MIASRIAIIISFYNGLETIRELVAVCNLTMSKLVSSPLFETDSEL